MQERDNTHLVEFDDVGVVQQLHDLHLSVNLLQVGGIQSGLVDDLNGHLENREVDGRFKVMIMMTSDCKYNHTLQKGGGCFTCVLVTLCLASLTTAKLPFPRVRMIS